MFKFIGIGKIIIVVLLLLHAQVAATTAERGLLWRITTSEGKVSYLFGTIHSEDARVLEFPEILLQAVRESPVFAMEIVPNLPTLRALMVAMQYPDGSRLEDKIGKELYARTAQRLKQYDIPESGISSMKIWAAAITLSTPKPETGMFLDFSLSLRAAASGATLTALETLEEQVGFMESLSEEDQRLMLKEALDGYEKMQIETERMVEVWLARDLDQLVVIARRQMAEMQPGLAEWFQKKGIEERNAKMLERALPLVRQGGVFIAVGALHLPGESGLIRGLLEAGHKLESIW